MTGASILSADTVKRIQTAGNPAAFAGGYVGGLMTRKFGDDAGKISNAYMWDAIMSDGDMFKGGVGGQGLYVCLRVTWSPSGSPLATVPSGMRPWAGPSP